MKDERGPVALLPTLEGLRLIASLGIVSVHMLPHVRVPVPHGFDLFVDLFFVISGIVIGGLYTGRLNTVRAYTTFLRRRIARIYPLHVATLLFYIVIGIGIARAHLTVEDPSKFDSRHIVPNLLMIQAWSPWGTLSFNFVSWSISGEFFVYLTFPLFALLASRRKIVGLAGVTLLLCAAVAIAELAMRSPLFELRWNAGELRAIPSFALGVWLSVHAGGMAPALSNRLWQVLFTVSAIALAVAMLAAVSGYALLALVYIVVASGYICDLRGAPTGASWAPLSRRGYLTYSLYMLHVPVTTVFVSFVFPRLLGSGSTAQAVGMALAIVILFVVANLSFRWFENPLRKALR